MDIEFIDKDHHFLGLQVLGVKPDTGQTVDAVRSVIFGCQLGPFPHPAHLVEPASCSFHFRKAHRERISHGIKIVIYTATESRPS